MTAVPTYDVVILCGGLGTRLRPVVSDRPKSMAPIGERPFLDILIDQIVASGLTRMILCVGYLADAIKIHCTLRTDCEIHFSQEPSPLGTAGALKLAVPLLRTSTLLVFNGDSYCPLNAAALIDFHRRKKAIGTVAMLPAVSGRAGGVLRVDEDDRVTEFIEKPGPSVNGYFNAGIYAFEQRAFDAIPEGTPCSLERSVLPRLQPNLYGWLMDAPLYDIGTPDGLHAFTEFYGRVRLGRQNDVSPVPHRSIARQVEMHHYSTRVHEAGG